MSKFPIIKFVLLFIIGIIFQNIFTLNPNPYLFFILFLLTIIFILKIFIKNNLANQILHISIGLLVFIVGAAYLAFNMGNEKYYPFSEPKIRNAEVVGEIVDLELIKSKKLTAEIKFISINGEELDSIKCRNFICNFWKDTSSSLDSIYDEIEIGNKISFIGTILQARNQRNPGEFDYENYLIKQGVSGIINCYKPESFQNIRKEADFFKNLIYQVRKQIDNRIKELHSIEASGLLKGILLADRADIDYDIRKTFVNSGVIHVLAVSGLHVGFISVIFFLILGRFDIRVKYWITIFGIILFLIITGGHPSVFRASTMAIVFLVAKLFNRSTNGFNSISIAALIILLIDPNDFLNPGFLLSFSAVMSILIIYPIFSAKINNLNILPVIKKILLFIAVSLAAQLGTLPFTLVYFNKLSVVSLFANLIVIPVIGFIVSIGIITLISSLISTTLASLFAAANILIIELLFYFVKNTSDLSFSFIPIYNFSLLDGFIFYLFLALLFFAIINIKKPLVFIIIFFFISISLSNYISLDDESLLPSDQFSFVTIDVGQGDSFLLKFPNGETALIDAGEATEYFDNGERIIYPLMKRLGIDKIDYAYITHLDSDHFAGIISLVNLGVIKTIFKPFDESIKDSVFEDFLSTNNVICNYYSNQSFTHGECNLYFLTDTSNYSYKNFDSNNKSGIIKIVYGNNSFLFAGDAEFEAEEYLVERYGEFLNADVLKVGHHGSKTSSSNSFLDMINPKIGIISAGVMNKFNHPSKSVLEKFEERNIEIRRTDYEGAVILASDGEIIKNIDWRNQ